MKGTTQKRPLPRSNLLLEERKQALREARSAAFSDSYYSHHPALLRTTSKGWGWVISSWSKLAALTAAGGMLAAGLTYFYAREVEPRWLEYRTLTLEHRNLPRAFDGYRIVQISDLHLAAGKLLSPSRLATIVAKVNRLKPDLILITGDFISALDDVSRAGIAALGKLRAADGIFGILGNHDYWTNQALVTREAERAGVVMLRNTHQIIRRKRQALVVAGLDDLWEGEGDLAVALSGAPVDSPVILMAHEPNYADIAARDERVILQLSGHSHGGQVRVPLAGPLALPDQAWRYPMGLYHVQDMLLYVNRGVGLAEIPLRLFCRPEITTLILRSANK